MSKQRSDRRGDRRGDKPEVVTVTIQDLNNLGCGVGRLPAENSPAEALSQGLLIILLIIFLIIISIIISILLSMLLTHLSLPLETAPPVDNDIEIKSEICITVNELRPFRS